MVARLGDVRLALKLERRFPSLEDRLVSSVEFLNQAEDDPTAGSPDLRRAVIAKTTADVEQLDFNEAIDLRPTVRAVAVSVAVLLLAGVLVAIAPTSSRIAVARLANPLGAMAWPRQNHLELVEKVERLARGGTFEVEVVDALGAKLPPAVQIHYRIEEADGGSTSKSELMRNVGSRAVARRENVVRPFSYRVAGGDDQSQPWIAVDVLEPPEIASLSIRLVPPAYTGWPPERSEGNICALVGTGLRIEAAATKPLQSAVLCLEGNRRVPARVSDDGLGFVVGGSDAGAGTQSPLIVDRSGSYWFELTDREGLTGGEQDRREIRAVPDSPPSVAVEDPTANVFVTPRAKVPLRVSAKDDLAVRAIALVFEQTEQADPSKEPPADGPAKTPGKTPEKAPDASGPSPPARKGEVPLYAGPEKVPPQRSGQLSGGAEQGDRRVVDYRWELAGLELSPGAQLLFHATATDYLPQTGASEPRRLIVITPEELQDRIAARESQILEELGRALKMQRSGRSQVEAIRIRLAETKRLAALDVDHLQGAELNQRQVNRTLTSRGEGVPMHILALLADLENNQVDSPDIARRVRGLLEEIDRLDREHLALIGRELTAGIKAAQVELDNGASRPRENALVERSLETAGRHQDAVIASLERMLGNLARWDNYRRFHREIRQLLHDQEEIAARTQETGRRTLTKDVKDLKPQEVADLKILASRQLDLARQFDRIQQEMQTTAAALEESDPLAATTVADALAEARRLAVSGKMRTAGSQLGENQIGQTAAEQKQIVRDLQDVLDILAGRRESELVRLVKKLQEAEADLDSIANRQGELGKEFGQAARQTDDAKRRQDLDRLGRQQQQLRQETDQLSRRLERLMADRAARTTQRAAGLMGGAGQCAGQGQGDQARQQAADAKKTLDDAKRELAQQRQLAQAELAVEQLAKLEDVVKHLHRQQQNVIDETGRFEGLRREQGQLTRAQMISLQNLAMLERSLRTDVVAVGDKLAGSGAFSLALGGVARQMDLAAAQLERRQTGAATVEAERNALRRLQMLLDALTPEKPDGDSASGTEGGGRQPGPQGDGVQTLAELKLLKLLQEEVNLRTIELQQSASGQGFTEPQRRECQSLSEEQGRLAALVLELIRPADANADDDPDNLPDMREDKPQDQPEKGPPRKPLPLKEDSP
jgi:hypothetical protein